MLVMFPTCRLAEGITIKDLSNSYPIIRRWCRAAHEEHRSPPAIEPDSHFYLKKSHRCRPAAGAAAVIYEHSYLLQPAADLRERAWRFLDWPVRLDAFQGRGDVVSKRSIHDLGRAYGTRFARRTDCGWADGCGKGRGAAAALWFAAVGFGVPCALCRVLARARQRLLGRHLRRDHVSAAARRLAAQGLVS